MLRAILVSAVWLNLGLLLGRLSGFLREALVAANFGVSFEADIVVLMLTVPDLMVSLLMGGAMGAVLVPAFSQSGDRARAMLYQAMLIFGFLFCVVSAALIWQSQALVSVLVPGFQADQASAAAAALELVLWLIPLTVLAGTTTAWLHAHNRFAIASLGTLLVNASIILGLYLVFSGRASIESLALFVLVGGLLRLASQLLAVRPSLQPLRHLRTLLLPGDLFLRYGQAMLSGSLLFLFPVLARAFASFEESGSVALLNYAMRLVELPLAICISFLSVILFPRLSQTYAADPEMHRRIIAYGIQATLALALIASIMLIGLSPDYAALVYGYGDMSADNLAQVAQLISIGLLVLPLQGLAIFNTAIFNSRRDTRTPMLINATGLLVYLLLLKFEVFGGGLGAIMWGLIASFGVILAAQWFRLRIEDLSFIRVYLSKRFVAGGLCAGALCFVLGQAIAGLQQPALLKLLLGFVAALACLGLMLLFYREARGLIRAGSGARQ